jgi:hypothetical protein
MFEQGNLSLQIGDTVEYNDFCADSVGEVIERINGEYLRIKWCDLPNPTVHARELLRRL